MRDSGTKTPAKKGASGRPAHVDVAQMLWEPSDSDYCRALANAIESGLWA